jgi:hypothetical protein
MIIFGYGTKTIIAHKIEIDQAIEMKGMILEESKEQPGMIIVAFPPPIFDGDRGLVSVFYVFVVVGAYSRLHEFEDLYKWF